MNISRRLWITLVAVTTLVLAAPLSAQNVAIRDLVIADAAPPVRLMGYGLVTGLPGTGDRVTGIYGSRQTVQSIVNLLRRFDVNIPEEYLRTRNVAAVLVTAEVSPYLHSGGRFDVRVSSLGDAQSLRGGTLWMTPLVSGPGAEPVAGAQGTLLIDAISDPRMAQRGVTAARVAGGGVLEGEIPRPPAGSAKKLFLREPDIGTATRIAAVIDSALGGKGNATVEDPGSVLLSPKDTSAGFSAVLARVRELRVNPVRESRLVIDARDGTISTGGDLQVGEAVVTHDGITVIVGSPPDSTLVRSAVRIATGTPARDIAEALRGLRATPAQTAAIFTALRDAGALIGEVVVR